MMHISLKSILFGLFFHVLKAKDIDELMLPYKTGPFKVREFSYGGIFSSELDQHYLKVWVPEVPGTFPVVYHLTGLADLVDPDTEFTVLSHMASHGFVVISPFTYYSLPTSQYNAEWMNHVDNWSQKNLQNKLVEEEGFDSKLSLDFEHTFVTAHSSGNHIVVNWMKLGCHNVKGIVMISPVDGVDPYGFIREYCITPGEKLNFETPTLIISAGLDGIPGISNTGGLVPPCASDELSNLRFWDALNGPAWFNNATSFGHVDFFDEGAISGLIELFHFCKTSSDEVDNNLYRKLVAGQAVAMFRGLMGKCELLDNLNDPTPWLPVLVQTKKQETSACPKAYCRYYG